MQTCLLKINNLLEKHNLDALLISSVPNITYLTGYSGFSSHEREAYVLITKTKRYIFTDGRYSEAVVKQVPHFILKEISTQSPFISLLQTLIKKHALKNIGFEEDDLSVLEYNKLRKIHKSLKPFTLSTLRIHKSSNEIVAIKNACAIGDKAFAHIVKQATLGITEKQLAIELELWIKHFGADISFPSIVAFGANAAIPHHQTSDQRLTTNSFVLLDFGVKLDNYCSDMTRTIFFGKPSEKQKKIYETVRIAQQNAIQLITYNLGLITSNKTSLKASEVD
ncbi:MAG: aminopeptidase P family protein, partial [Candidatus Levybacteria bacterium]|nr:aminopeptidase P family protein [Candidatus Levybacteria bacterium]